MLQKLKDQSGRWHIKVLFVLLVISFSIWGIADIFVNYVNTRPVATVDGHTITQEEFGGRLQNTVTKAQEMSKGQVTVDQIKEMGIPQKILDSLIDQALIAAELKKRRLVVTDADIRRRIQSMPAFLNEQGAFDKRAFDYLLHNNHITEAQFIGEIRSELQQQQLFKTLLGGMRLPAAYIDLLFQGFFEQRVFAVVTVPLSKVTVKETPRESDLEKFYQENQTLFTVPEMRSVTLLEIDPKVLKDQITITQDQLQDEYERRNAEFEIAEKREVKQITFKDEETAKKAIASLKKGRPVPAAARDFAAEFKDLGLVTKQQLPDLVADTLFASELGQITGPISTPFGWQVYVISKIEPSFTKSFLEMRSQLESEMKARLANEQIEEIKNKVEDALAGGSTLAEIAKEHNFKVQVIDAVSRTGKNLNDKYVVPEAGRTELLDQIFSLAEKSDSPVIDTKEGISYVAHVEVVKVAHVPSFADVKDKVLKAWTQGKRFELCTLIAQQLVKDAHSVADLSRLALSRKLSIRMLDPLSRIDSETDEKIQKQFTPQLINQMFELTAGKAIFGITPDQAEGGIQVVMLQKALPFNPKPLQEKRNQMEKKLADLAYQDALTLYVKSLRSKASISVNQAVYNAMVNRGS